MDPLACCEILLGVLLLKYQKAPPTHKNFSELSNQISNTPRKLDGQSDLDIKIILFVSYSLAALIFLYF
jgi:hypothetical protein